MDESHSIGRLILFGIGASACVVLALALEYGLGFFERRQVADGAALTGPPPRWPNG